VARRARYREIVLKAGYYARSGEPISPQITAQAIIDLVRLPRAETNTAIVGH
jgi:meso-butanediol dehydrogenase / (S,S)-butanediol dehydrogenase / diacetyl reductase